MRQITININPSIYEYIMFFLQNLPKNLIDIQTQNRTIISKKPNKDVFGILNGKIENPMKWQEDIRLDSDRDIYKSFQK